MTIKKLLYTTLVFLTFQVSAQENKSKKVTPDISIMAAASDHSKDGEIGVYVIAGTEFENLTDNELNIKFDKIMKDTGIGIELFIQRTAMRKASTYDLFVDGKSVGDTVGYSNLKTGLKRAIKRHKTNRGLPTDK